MSRYFEIGSPGVHTNMPLDEAVEVIAGVDACSGRSIAVAELAAVIIATNAKMMTTIVEI